MSTNDATRPVTVVELQTYGELSSRSGLAVVADAGQRTIVRSQTSSAATSWTCGRCGVSSEPDCVHALAVHAAMTALAKDLRDADHVAVDLAATP